LEVLDPTWAAFLADSLGDLERTFADSEKAKQLIEELPRAEVVFA
jgi:hypothetical protein